jgi:hypothetical protein
MTNQIIRRKIASFLSVLLALSLFQVASSAPAGSAPAVISKKIIVRDSSGNLYPGAQVQLSFDDQTGTGLKYSGFSSIAVTDVNGVADVTAPDTVSWLNLTVQPPASDLTQAVYSKTMNLDDETFNITLKAANLRVKIVKADGTDAKANAQIYTNSLSIQPIRTGAFGVYLSPQDLIWGGYFGACPAEDEVRSQLCSDYQVKNVTSGGSSSYKLFDNEGTLITADGSNVFPVKFKQGNVSGNLVNADGTPYVLPEGVSASIHFWRLTSSGSRWYAVGSTAMRAGEDSWAMQLWNDDDQTVKKYEITVQFENSLTLGSVTAGNIWVDRTGKFSATETGTYTSALNLSLKVTPGTPTLGFVVKDLAGNLVNANYNLYVPALESNLNSSIAASKGNLTLPDGKYGFTVSPATGSKQISTNFTILINNGAVTVTDELGNSAPSTSKVFDLTLKPINLRFQLSDPNTLMPLRISPNVQLQQQIVSGKGTYWEWIESGWVKIDSVTIGMSVPVGKFRLGLSANNNDAYGKKYFDLVRTGNTVTIDNAGPSLPDSTFRLPLNLANFKFKIVDPVDLTTPLLNSYINGCSTDLTLGPIERKQSCFGSGVNEEGLGSTYLAPGTYQLRVEGGELNTSRLYAVSVDNSNVVSVESPTVSAGRFILHPTKPNLMGSLYHADGTTPITFSDTQSALVELEYTDLNGNVERRDGRYLNPWNTQFGFNLFEPGKYRLAVTPRQITDYANTFSDYIYVNSSNQLSKTLNSGYGSELSDYKVSLKQGNLPLTITNPIDGAPLKSAGLYIYSKQNSFSQHFDLWSSLNGQINVNLEANTQSTIVIEPWDNPTLVRKEYTVTVDAEGVPTIRDGSSPVLQNGARYTLSAGKANLSGQIVASDGNKISGVDWLEIMLQRSEKYFDKASNSTERWYNYAGANSDQDGNFGLSVKEAGKYRISARPYGNSEVATGYSPEFTVAPESVTAFTKDFGKIRLATPAIKIKAKAAGSADFASIYDLSIQQNGMWIENPYVNSSGVAALNITDPGTYDVLLYPSRKNSSTSVTSKKYKLTVESNAGVVTNSITGIGSSVSGGFTVLEFGTPNLSGQVRTPDSSTSVSNINVMAVDAVTQQERGEYSSSTDQDGKWSLNLEKGTYKIYARAPWGSIAYSSSEFIGDVVVNETGTVTSMPEGTSANNLIVQLTTPTWSGLIKSPDSSSVVPYASICLSGYSSVYKGGYGWCTNANDEGQWALKLPSTVTLNSDSQLWANDWNQRLYPEFMVRGKTAIEALLGTSGTNKVINFPAPNIEVTVNEGSNPSIGSWVNVNQSNGQRYLYGETNSNGVASMYSDQLTGPMSIQIHVPNKSDVIPSYVSTTATFTETEVTNQTSAGKFRATVALKQPNFKGIVRDPVSKAAIANTWVEIRNESDNEWVPGASLTSSGTFGVYLKGSCCSATTKEYTITVNEPWDGTSKSVRKQYKALVNSNDVVTLYDKRSNAVVSTEPISGDNFFSMTLQEPNFKAIVREPANGSTPGNIASWSYGEYGSVSWGYANVYNTSTGEWSWGQRIDSDGTLSMYLPGGCCQSSKEYEVTLYPAWNSVGTFVTKKYKVVTNYLDVPTVTDWRTGDAVPTETMTGLTYQSLSYGAPNVTGSVVNMYDTGTAYSWVTFNKKITDWADYKAKGYKGCGNECYFYSGIDGRFATNIEDGDYDVTAQQKWWGEFEGAQSATCALKIETGTIRSGNNCLQNDGRIKLKLRAPNFTLTLNDGTGPVRNAWVSLGIGNYWTGARSDENGYVGIYIDTETVSSNNYEQTGTKKIRVYVDPPWASTTMSRWNCESGDSKPICNAISDYTLGTTFAETNLGTITPAKPNTTISVTRPGPDSPVSAGWHNYVTIYRMNSGYLDWIGWSATNSEGLVAINVETTTATADSKYQVHIEPAWHLRNDFTYKQYDNGGLGYSWTELNNGTFALGSPNLKVTSLLPDSSTLNKWGWAGIEYVNESLTATSWFTSAGLNEFGRAAFTLPADSKFKLTLNPGPGRYGTSTACYLQTDANSVVSKISGQCASGETTTATSMSFTLARGNVVGRIQAADGTGIAGAVIYANIDGATNEDAQVVSCSTSTGEYGLILKPGQTYKIKVFPVNKSGVTYRDNLEVPALLVPESGSTPLNITLLT